MVYGDGGVFGIAGNLESATCRFHKAAKSSTPTFTTPLHAGTHGVPGASCDVRGQSHLLEPAMFFRPAANPQWPGTPNFRRMVIIGHQLVKAD